MARETARSFTLLGHIITPELVHEICQKASSARWGTHLLRWRYFDVHGYYRTDPPRLQWGFLNPTTGKAVVYDVEADLIATLFKPEEGTLFFERQIGAVKIDRKEWDL